jgi:EAL domain-containing protein (putative c-di-GMP-specific phosphodiesterase class I)
MRVCAEGVETQAAFDFLAAAGCDSMQGVLFAKPMPATEVEQFVARHELPMSVAAG